MGTDAASVPGIVLEDRLIDARGHHACEVRKGEVYRIVDVEGQQVADFLCFNLHRLEEKLSPHNTLLLNNQVFPGVGYTLYLGRGRRADDDDRRYQRHA